MYKNYHTHTLRCKHAEGTPEDYVKEAIKLKGSVLGFSDHVPFPDDRWIKWRMGINELESYVEDLDEVKRKYSSKITIYKGLECEYVPEFYSFYEKLLEDYKFDYLCLGPHYFYENGWIHADKGEMTPMQLDSYAKLLVEAMHTGFFQFIAHPDFFGASYLEWDKYAEKASIYIIENALKLNIPLEVNANGLRKKKVKTSKGERYPYPLKEFFKIAIQYKAPIIINSDAHKPEQVYDFDKCKKFLSNCNL